MRVRFPAYALVSAAEPAPSIQPPAATSIRIDHAEPSGKPALEALYRARVLDAYSLGVQAYVYGWPTVDNYRVCSRLLGQMDLMRATEAHLWGIPAAGMIEWKNAQSNVLKVRDGQLVSCITQKQGISPPNYTTPYIATFTDLSKTGPIVLTLPKGLMAGMVKDVNQRVMEDLGGAARTRARAASTCSCRRATTSRYLPVTSRCR